MSQAALPSLAAETRIAGWFDELAAHFTAVSDSAVDQTVNLVVAGVSIEFCFAGTAIRDELLPAIVHHQRAAEIPTWRVLVAESRSDRSMPSCPWGVDDIGVRGEVAAATIGPFQTSYFGPSNALSTIDVERRIAMFWVPDARHLPWYERAAPLRTLLHWILSRHGSRLVHAAAVAPPGSHSGVLLAGGGGSGKSTTAMLCLGAGFGYAGDDYAAVSVPRNAADRPRVHTLFSTAKLSVASMALVPFLVSGIRLAPRDGEKGVVDLAAIYPERLTGSFPLAAVIVPRVSGGATRLRRATQAEALRALAPTTLLQLPGNGSETFRDIAVIAASLPAWSLELGDDLEEIPRWVARTIEEVL